MAITWQQAVAATKLRKCCFGGNRRRQHEHGDTDDEDDIAIEHPGTHPQMDLTGAPSLHCEGCDEGDDGSRQM